MACLSDSTLDRAVVNKAFECLAGEGEGCSATNVCKESELEQFTATRASVTDVQKACAAKDTECGSLKSYCDAIAPLSEDALLKFKACTEKPCANVKDCVRGVVGRTSECIQSLF